MPVIILGIQAVFVAVADRLEHGFHRRVRNPGRDVVAPLIDFRD